MPERSESQVEQIKNMSLDELENKIKIKRKS